MCGICGLIGLPEKKVLQKMTSTLTHRGPDDGDVYIHSEQAVGLGHQRLSIQDITQAGRQPMQSDDGKIVLSYNGEIYNFPQLRVELKKLGYRFKSTGDTEVILHAYAEYGIDFITKIRGMFAMAIADFAQRKTFLIRDHFGIKPLYYAQTTKELIFGSEIKAILASNKVNKQLNMQAVSNYFSFLFIPDPLTIYQEIKQIPAGSYLAYDHSTRQSKMTRYWKLERHSKYESMPWEAYRH